MKKEATRSIGSVVIPVVLLVALAWAPQSKAISPGEKAPAFELPATDGKTYNSRTIFPANKATVVVFTCNTCPVAKAYEDRIIALAGEYQPQSVKFLAINPNDSSRIPAESFDEMKKRAAEKEFNFPYLWDESQAVAKAYGAKVTPHFFVADAEGIVRYVGRLDNNQQQNPNVNTSLDLKNSLEALLKGDEPPASVTKAFGCGIKWKQ
jgi:peroxiredoxin